MNIYAKSGPGYESLNSGRFSDKISGISEFAVRCSTKYADDEKNGDSIKVDRLDFSGKLMKS